LSDWNWNLVKLAQRRHRQYIQTKERRLRWNNTVNAIITVLDDIGWGVVLFTMCYIEWQVLSYIFKF